MGSAEPSRVRLAPEAVLRPRSVCALMRAETRRGADDAFATLMDDLAQRVRSDEPGCESYVVTRALGSSAHFVVHARFADWDAFEAHADTAHMARMAPRLNALLAGPIAMEIFLEA